MNPTIAKSIKIVSILAITGALGLEAANLYLLLQGKSLPSNLSAVFWLANIALIVHSMQGFVAASKARSHDENPLTCGIYTFFVGFIGLKELEQK